MASYTRNSSFYKGTSVYFSSDIQINSLLSNTGMWQRLKDCNVSDIQVVPVLQLDANNDTDTDKYNTLKVGFTKSVLENFIRYIRSLGFRVHYKVHINNSNNVGAFAHTAGNLYPTNLNKFFTDFTNVCVSLVDSGEDIESFCLLNEATNITSDANCLSFFEVLINKLRIVNPNMKIIGIIYQNQLPSFYSYCDMFAFNVYPKGRDGIKVETTKEYIKNFYIDYLGNNYIEKIVNTCLDYNKPFILSESGICPFEYASKDPAVWIQTGNVNRKVQENYLNAMLSIFLNMDICMGTFIWNSNPLDPYCWDYSSLRDIVTNYYGGL